MSDKRADSMPVAQMAPITPSEKLARFQLLGAQIDAAHGEGSTKAAELRKAILSNMSEEETIRNDVLLNISQYKPSTPEWYMLVSLCENREDAFDQAEFLAHQIYQQQKTEIALSYFTPSKNSVREGFVTSAIAGTVARAGKLKEVEARVTGKKSILATAAASAASAVGFATEK